MDETQLDRVMMRGQEKGRSAGELRTLFEEGVISELDLHFGRFMERLAGRSVPGLALCAGLVSRTTREGHICLDLADPPPPLCATKGMLKGLRQSGVVGRPGDRSPLILDEGGRLYLYRYWEYQERLRAWIAQRVNQGEEDLDLEGMKERLSRLFPGDQTDGEVNWQKVSAFIALNRPFCVLSGGPGTGKTTTASRILALLIEQAWPVPLRVALASPTGKGAARLQEAIQRSKGSLPCSDGIRGVMPAEASTLHRLLGTVEGSPYFRHNAINRLEMDVVLIDEASMVDLALMAKVVDALAPECRLILLGDKDQLASVEAGAVLGDICDTGKSHGYSKRLCDRLRRVTGYTLAPEEREGRDPPAIADSMVHLTRSYRFGPHGGIAALGSAVNQGDGDLGLGLLRRGGFSDLFWKTLPPIQGLARAMREGVLQGFREVFLSKSAQEVQEGLDHFRILCALREGPFGAHAVNRVVERVLRGEGLIQGDGRWYPGRPVMITRNDYALRLFNGDVGVALEDPLSGRDLRVFFAGPEGEVRRIHPLRLPEHETVYAMTVHKAQGSEFDRVVLLLPDRDSPVLTRELIYTAVTRARRSVEIWGTEEVFRTALSRRIERRSGLREALWSAPGGS